MLPSLARRSARLSPSLLSLGRAKVDIHPEIQEALASRKAIVALETTIVTHGLPYPINVENTNDLDRIIRSTGAIPAVIGVIDGRVKIGLEAHELERLAHPDGKDSVLKISRRDIGPALALKRNGGTTISATSLFAHLAGIKVFATGGLGGVHRGGQDSLDISADLQELARTPVAVVSAGVKSILDIGRTLEYLETLGVPVVSYGESKEFPAFFSRHSGFDAPYNINDPAIAAAMLHSQWQLGLTNGALIAVPIPGKFEAIGASIQAAVEAAVAESEANGISKNGKEATPWLLKRVWEMTKGDSLPSNRALIENTALIGGQIAVEYAKLEEEEASGDKLHKAVQPERKLAIEPTPVALASARLVVIGTAAVDITAQTQDSTDFQNQSTSPGSVRTSLGGVGRNIAEATHSVLTHRDPRHSGSTLLVSPIGSDSFGRLLLDETKQLGMRTDGFVVDSEARTAVCNMILDSSGSLIGGVADFMIQVDSSAVRVVGTIINHPTARIVALDGNLDPTVIKVIVKHCNEQNIDILFEPTSIAKSTGILPAISVSLDNPRYTQSPIQYVSPNLFELTQIYNTAQATELTSHDKWWKVIDDFSLGSAFRMDVERLSKRPAGGNTSKETLAFLVDHGVVTKAVNLLPFFKNLVVKCGGLGVLVVLRGSNGEWEDEKTDLANRRVVTHGREGNGETVVVQHFPALQLETGPHNVTGAGDSLVGSLLATLVQDPTAFRNPTSLRDAIDRAQRMAILTLQSPLAVGKIPAGSDV